MKARAQAAPVNQSVERAARMLGLPLEVRETGETGLEDALERLLEEGTCS